MNVADIKLCKELYGLSGWSDTEKIWCHYIGNGNTSTDTAPYVRLVAPIARDDDCPAYELGYLLRRLPKNRIKLRNNNQTGWGCQYNPGRQHGPEYNQYGATPENATCRLAIELIREGIIEP